MYWYRVSSALAAIVAFGTFLIAASSQAGQYEGAPTFSAAQAIQGVPLHGADYSLSARVPVENFQYAFSVNTKWGPLRVKGSDGSNCRKHRRHGEGPSSRKESDAAPLGKA